MVQGRKLIFPRAIVVCRKAKSEGDEKFRIGLEDRKERIKGKAQILCDGSFRLLSRQKNHLFYKRLHIFSLKGLNYLGINFNRNYILGRLFILFMLLHSEQLSSFILDVFIY